MEAEVEVVIRLKEKSAARRPAALAALGYPLCASSLIFRPLAGVAQLVEQRIRNARVGSSNLFSGTTIDTPTPRPNR